MIKKIIISLCILFSSSIGTVQANTTLASNAGAAILLDYDSGKVLSCHNETEKMYPASTTKIMTMILLFEAINDGRITFEDTIQTSAYAASMGGSQVYLEAGETMTAYDMFKSIAIASANDASVAVGEKIGGSIESFVGMMNDKAKELELVNTHFVNATGLHDDGHYTCAYDLGIMAQYLIKIGQEQLFEVTSLYDSYIREDSGEKFWLVNTNKLLKQYDGIDGLKTGYTKEAGYCLVSTVEKDGVRLIGVILNESDPSVRNVEMCNMLDYGFMNYKKEVIFEEGAIVGSLEIQTSPIVLVDTYVKEEISLLLEVTSNEEISTSIHYFNDQPPISTEEPVGVIEVLIDNKIVNQYDIYSMENVAKQNFIEKLWIQFKGLL